jgi:chaperonin cofactor prefoldin
MTNFPTFKSCREAYEQGKKDALKELEGLPTHKKLALISQVSEAYAKQKQIEAYEDVLKEIDKLKMFWKKQDDTFDFSPEMRFNLKHQLEMLEQRIKELSKTEGD